MGAFKYLFWFFQYVIVAPQVYNAREDYGMGVLLAGSEISYESAKRLKMTQPAVSYAVMRGELIAKENSYTLAIQFNVSEFLQPTVNIEMFGISNSPRKWNNGMVERWDIGFQ